jgi:hypothetical protein
MKIPAKVRLAVRLHIATWRRDESHGVIPRLIRPRKVYRHIGSAGRGGYQFVGWRVFLRTTDQNVLALDVMRNGAYRFYSGADVSNWLARIQAAAKWKLARGCEPRLLTVPAIHRTLLWFVRPRPGKSDLFDYLDGTQVRKQTWMTKSDVDQLVQTSITSASQLWEAAKKRTPEKVLHA